MAYQNGVYSKFIFKKSCNVYSSDTISTEACLLISFEFDSLLYFHICESPSSEAGFLLLHCKKHKDM